MDVKEKGRNQLEFQPLILISYLGFMSCFFRNDLPKPALYVLPLCDCFQKTLY